MPLVTGGWIQRKRTCFSVKQNPPGGLFGLFDDFGLSSPNEGVTPS